MDNAVRFHYDFIHEFDYIAGTIHCFVIIHLILHLNYYGEAYVNIINTNGKDM